MYCEAVSSMSSPDSAPQKFAASCIMDFWGKVTPGILQLLSHAKWVSDNINVFLSNYWQAYWYSDYFFTTKSIPH